MKKNKSPAQEIRELKSRLLDIINDFETAGCEGCGTVQTSTINAARRQLGMEPLE